MDVNKFIDALGTPEEWSRIPDETTPEEVTPGKSTPDVNTQKIIGSVSTKEEIDQALDSLKQD